MPYTYRFDADGTEARWSDKDGVIITGPDELGFREFVSRELTMYLPPDEQPADPQGAPPGAIVEPIASTLESRPIGTLARRSRCSGNRSR